MNIMDYAETANFISMRETVLNGYAQIPTVTIAHLKLTITIGALIGRVKMNRTTKNGLLHCKECGKPLQVRLDLFGKSVVLPCICECQEKKLKANEEAREKERRMRALSQIRETGFPDKQMRKWTFEHDDRSNEKLSDIAMRYVENFDRMLKTGKGLLFYGSVGCGKSFISACIANALIDQWHPCLMTNFHRLSQEQDIRGLEKFDLLIIDDLASERKTEYMNEIVHSVIDERLRSGKPLIVTTNLTGDEMKHPASIEEERLFSRLFEMCIPIEVKGRDRRKEKLKRDYEEAKEVLGL